MVMPILQVRRPYLSAFNISTWNPGSSVSDTDLSMSNTGEKCATITVTRKVLWNQNNDLISKISNLQQICASFHLFKNIKD